jgi:hypothetical protein
MQRHGWWKVFFILGVVSVLETGAPRGGFASAELFTDAGSERAAALSMSRKASEPSVIKNRYVRVNLDRLKGDRFPEGAESILLNLFDGISYKVDRERLEKRSSTRYTWFGRVAGAAISQVVLVVEDGNMTGNILADGDLYQIRPVQDDVHIVRAIDQTGFPEEAPPIPVPIEPGQSTSLSSLAAADDGSVIDVLVVYTSAVAKASPNITAEIQLAVDETNQSYANSGVAQRVRLVHAAQVQYAETGKSDTDLTRLRNPNDGYMDEVHSLRDTYGADLVSLWVESLDACGIGFLMTNASHTFESFAFSVIARQCATGYYSFGHEMGHNMGATHDRYVNDGDGVYPYSHGYVYTPGKWRTVMAYDRKCSDKGYSCTRIPYWSNPGVSYQGSPTGVPETAADSANNRLTLNNTAFTVANFRASVSPSLEPNLTPYQPQGWSDKVIVSEVKKTYTDSGTLFPADTLYVDFAVINDSDAAIQSEFSIALVVDGVLKDTWPINGLDAHYYAYVTDYPIGSLPPGTHTLKIVADSTGAISESNEGDNEYTKTIVVKGPDLVGQWVLEPVQSCRSSERGRSCRITGSLVVSNLGNWKAASTYANFYLSGEGGDLLMKHLSIGSLRPGASKTLRFNYFLPLNDTATGKFVKVIIDPDRVVEESDETNNALTFGPIQ